jgi:hypothetical protein
MDTVFELLSNEDQLNSKAINGYSECFLIESLLIYMDECPGQDLKFFLYYLENDILPLFNRIKKKIVRSSYIEDLERIISRPISKEDVPFLKIISEKIYNDHFKEQSSEITIKLLQ